MNNDLISRDAVLDACSQSINILDAMSRIEDLPSVKPKPCEDAISRQAAIDVVSGIDRHFVKYIKELPPVTPKHRTGHWITQWNPAHQKEYYYCSECREEYSYDGETGIKMNNYNYCPNCGAQMAQESEEQTDE